jgi:hypothetical protein
MITILMGMEGILHGIYRRANNTNCCVKTLPVRHSILFTLPKFNVGYSVKIMTI